MNFQCRRLPSYGVDIGGSTPKQVFAATVTEAKLKFHIAYAAASDDLIFGMIEIVTFDESTEFLMTWRAKAKEIKESSGVPALRNPTSS